MIEKEDTAGSSRVIKIESNDKVKLDEVPSDNIDWTSLYGHSDEEWYV